MSLWTLKSLETAVRGTLSGAPADTPVTGISIDTRTLGPGEVYFAIKGVSMDGHEFVPAALRAGAVAAVISRGAAQPAIVVDDCLLALARAGVAARARLAAGTPVVAVTGSVGKTGTKDMLRLAFGAQGSAHASAASYNNHWGVPLSLARMPQDTDAGIFEIGMNHAGEITPLTQMVRPTIAIITAVAPVHLELLGSMEAIADAKSEIFAGLPDGGTAIIPATNPFTPRLRRHAEAAGARMVTFAHADEDARADVTLTHYDADTATCTARVHGQPVTFRLGQAGLHYALNALTVLAAVHAAGRPLEPAAAALANWLAPAGRGRWVRLFVGGGEALLLDDAFNASPMAVAAALQTLKRAPAKRRIAILGDMLELGPNSDDFHRGLAPLLLEADARIVHTVGPMMQHLRDTLPVELRGTHAQTTPELLAALPNIAAGDAVLVKSSKAVGLSAIVAALEASYGPGGKNV